MPHSELIDLATADHQFKVLVVDDTQVNLDLISSALKNLYEVHTAISGKVALDCLLSKNIDLILLDVMMPKMTGFELCKILKNDVRYSGIPILFLTAKNDEASISHGFKLGANDYITKPFRYTEVIARIKNHLDVKLAHDQLKQNLETLISQRKIEKIEQLNERLLNERKLMQSQKMEAIGLLAGGIAHDFNNQLTGIMGATELLHLTTEGTDLEKFTDIIMRSSTSASKLIKSLALFAKSNNELQAKMDLKKSLDAVIGLLHHSVDKKIIIEKEFHVEQALCLGNYAEIENIFLNIALNGSQAMKDTGGHLKFSLKNTVLSEAHCKASNYDISPGDYYVIQITDQGSGIKEENINKIFDPFYTTKRRQGGSGMGLSQVYGILCDHHADIKVNSKIGKGTEFTIYIPVENSGIEPQTHKPVLTESSGTNHKIMIVDDDERALKVASEILRKSGFQVVAFRDCDKAQDYYKLHHSDIDLLLLDFIMPKMNGLELYKILKHINNDIKVIVLTGYNEANVDQCLDAGINDFMFKPYTISDLLSAVKNTLPQED